MLAIIHLEVRLAFKSCARIHSIRRVERRTFTTFPPLRDWKRGPSAATEHYSASKRPASGTPAVVENSSESAEPRLSKGNDHELSGSSTTELVPRRPKPDSLQHPRRADVPARVLPKTQVSADLTLSPKERLRLEYETRRPPKPPEKPGEHNG